MKKAILSICFTAFLFTIYAQNKNEVLFSVGNESITATEFINTYNRNNSFEKAAEKEVRDYLELYINFKLKVRDGLDSQIDTAEIFRRELASYRSQSAKSYMADREVTEQLINEALERSPWMLRASHIMIHCAPTASPQDSLEAYNKILDIRKKITSGTLTFAEAALQYSDDNSARDDVRRDGKIQYGNKGDLGYFSTFDLLYPFETGAYNTPVGTISMPVRTQHGYHIINVIDKQPVISRISISQILLLDSTAHSGSMTPDVKEKIKLIKEALASGQDFASVAEQYTDDLASKENGGKLEPFSYNRRPGNFIKQCISLEKDQISEPFPSVAGWHIVQLHELILPEVKEEEKRHTMATRVQRDTRSTKSVESLIETLKKAYNYSDKNKKTAFNLMLKKMEKSDLIPAAIELLAALGNDKLKPIATFATETITIEDLAQYIDKFKGLNFIIKPIDFLENQFTLLFKERILKYELENLENRLPEYRELISEYHHGMILFEMNNLKIWSKSLKDTANFEIFYEETKFNYLDSEGNPKPLAEIRSNVLTDYQNELEKKWLAQLREKYPVWINEELFKSILKNK